MKIILFLLTLLLISGCTHPDSNTFKEELQKTALEDGLQPIEGFDAHIFLNEFPGLTEQDFNNVITLEGEYKVIDGILTYQRTQGNPITSAEQMIIDEGYSTLYNNLIERFSTTNIQEILNEISLTNFEKCVNKGNPIMESYPRKCRDRDITYTEII